MHKKTSRRRPTGWTKQQNQSSSRFTQTKARSLIHPNKSKIMKLKAKTGKKITTRGEELLEEVEHFKYLISFISARERRRKTWPNNTDLATKLWGTVEDLCRTAQFAPSLDLKIGCTASRTQKKKKKKKNLSRQRHRERDFYKNRYGSSGIQQTRQHLEVINSPLQHQTEHLQVQCPACAPVCMLQRPGERTAR